MSKLSIIFALVILFACSEDREIQYTVNPALTAYVDEFYSAAQARNVTIPKNLIAEIQPGAQSLINVSKDGDQRTLYVTTGFLDISETGKEYFMILNLSKLFVDKSPEEVIEILQTSTDKNQVFDRLFN
jgi:hypothetical protein